MCHKSMSINLGEGVICGTLIKGHSVSGTKGGNILVSDIKKSELLYGFGAI